MYDIVQFDYVCKGNLISDGIFCYMIVHNQDPQLFITCESFHFDMLLNVKWYQILNDFCGFSTMAEFCILGYTTQLACDPPG